MWKVIKIVFYMVLFSATAAAGIHALVDHTDAGWLTGFAFCVAGDRLFGRCSECGTWRL